MKTLICILFSIISFARIAHAEKTYTCQSQDQIAYLKIGDIRIKTGSYKECTGGYYGEEVTNCVTHEYQVPVRDAHVELKVEDGFLLTETELHLYNSDFQGSAILYNDTNAFHLNLKGTELASPSIAMKIMAKGTPGRPVEVGNYTLLCR